MPGRRTVGTITYLRIKPMTQNWRWWVIRRSHTCLGAIFSRNNVVTRAIERVGEFFIFFIRCDKPLKVLRCIIQTHSGCTIFVHLISIILTTFLLCDLDWHDRPSRARRFCPRIFVSAYMIRVFVLLIWRACTWSRTKTESERETGIKGYSAHGL